MNSISEFYNKLVEELADGYKSYDNYCSDVVGIQQPNGKTIAIPQYKSVPHPWDKLFNDVTKALTRGGKEEDSFPRIAAKWHCSEEECALRMAELKIARIETGKEKEDSYVDAIGYLVLAWQKYCKGQSKQQQNTSKLLDRIDPMALYSYIMCAIVCLFSGTGIYFIIREVCK